MRTKKWRHIVSGIMAVAMIIMSAGVLSADELAPEEAAAEGTYQEADGQEEDCGVIAEEEDTEENLIPEGSVQPAPGGSLENEDLASIGLIEEADADSEDSLEKGEEISQDLEASNITDKFGIAVNMTLGTPNTVAPTEARYFKFTSSKDAVYDFYTISTDEDSDPFLRVFDQAGNFLLEDDDNDRNYSVPAGLQEYDSYFRITIKSGVTYYLMAYVYRNTYNYNLYVREFSTDSDDIDDYTYTAAATGELKTWKMVPTSQKVYAGKPVTLKVGWSIAGSATPSFRWEVDGSAVAGNTDTLVFTPKDGGVEYEVTVYVSYDGSQDDHTFYVETEDHTHSYGAWRTDRPATALAAGSMSRTCSGCGDKQTQPIAKLSPFISFNFSGELPLKTGQKTSKVAVQLQTGDYVTSWSSSNTKVVSVNGSGTLKAAKKTGKAVITVKTAAGLTATFKVKVGKATVKTKKISVATKKITLKKGQSFNLNTTVSPITNQDKLTYSISNKKIVKVSKSGVITAKKKGKATVTVKSGRKKVKVKVNVVD